jgi:hypothetical protein
MTVIKLALAAAVLGATAHPTPKVVLVKHADFIKGTLANAKQYFVRTVSIGKQDLATIRKESDFTPDDPDVQFYLGQGDDLRKALQGLDGRLGAMPQYMAELIATAVGRGLVVYATLYKENAS